MPVSARTHLLVSALSVHRKRAHSPSSKDEHSIGLKDSLLAHSSDPVEMRRLNYQTPGKEQLILLNPAFSGSPSPCMSPCQRQSCSPSHPPGDPHLLSHSDTEWALDQGCPGVCSLGCKSFSLALSLQAQEAGEPGWGWPVVWCVSDMV